MREETLTTSPLRLERIRCPAMVVLAGVREEVLAGIGHMPQVEAPARLVEILNDFVSDGHREADRCSA